jgi:hypothetical protein
MLYRIIRFSRFIARVHVDRISIKRTVEMIEIVSSTIGDLKADLGRALTSVRKLKARGELPQELDALTLLSPGPDQEPTVGLYCDGRKKRADAGADYWDLSSCEVRITMRPAVQGSTPAGRSDQMASPPATARTVDPEVTIVKKLAEAEVERPFVALKFLRDRLLPSVEASWTQEPELRQKYVAAAIARGLLTTSKVPNPTAPQFPTTAVRVNRAHPLVQEVLEELSGFEEGFSPVAIRGRPLSDTVLEDRR